MAASASSARAKRRQSSVAATKKARELPETDMRRYDWTRAKRGRYARYAPEVAAHVRILDSDLAKLFPTDEDVNAALRAVAAAAKRMRKAG